MKEKNLNKEKKRNRIFSLFLYKSNKHIYLQLFNIKNSRVILSSSTNEKNFRLLNNISNTCSYEAARIVAYNFIIRANSMNIKDFSINFSKYPFLGIVKYLFSVINMYFFDYDS